MSRKPVAGDSSSPPAPPPRYFTIADVANYLDVCTRTVRRWISAGILPVHRIGSVTRISEADLAEFLARSRGLS